MCQVKIYLIKGRYQKGKITLTLSKIKSKQDTSKICHNQVVFQRCIQSCRPEQTRRCAEVQTEWGKKGNLSDFEGVRRSWSKYFRNC